VSRAFAEFVTSHAARCMARSMTPKRTLAGLLCASSVVLASIAACAGAAPPAGAAQGWTPDPDADEMAGRDRAPADAGDGGPRCPYGALEDPHRGFVRCLLPEERDAGWLPPPPEGDAPPADPPKAEIPKDAGVALPPPLVEIGAPKFENGEVTRVERSLGKAAGDLARCVAEHGGLSGDQGSVKIQFLVRSRGRAEGVEVLAAKGVSAEASGCVRHLIKNKAIGAPTSDPVGVTVTITFKAAR
jgi:hypothetical protein